MKFDIREHCEFDSRGRAVCPSCKVDGKGSKKNLSLVPDTDGAYKCHRGCSPDQIRQALGHAKDKTVPVAIAQQKSTTTVPPHKVAEAHNRLLEKSVKAISWLADRGISEDCIKRFKLGISRAKVGRGHMPCITIPIPNDDGTAYWQKKRIAPWLLNSDRPADYQPWSQFGIPQQIFFTHLPEKANTTYLCEGEWDAMLLGFMLQNHPSIAVACFTCGCSAIPPVEQLDRLPGDVVIFYDLDEPGQRGAGKLAEKLGSRSRIATVPSPEEEPVKGWDISNWLTCATDTDKLQAVHTAAANAQAWKPPKKENPLRNRLLTHDELVAQAPDYTDWLVDDLLTSDELFVLAASPRAGKSLMAMSLAHAVATGGTFLGRPATKGTVIYIKCEDSDTKVKERSIAQGWESGLDVYWLNRFKLTELDHLIDLCEELNPRLIVFDTLSRIRRDATNEGAAEMSFVLEPLQNLCNDFNTCGLLVHHTNKVTVDNAGNANVFDSIRGSSAIRATCRGSLVLAADERKYRLYVENGWNKLDLDVLLDAHTLKWKLLGNWTGPNVEVSQKDRVIEFLNQVGSATIHQIEEATNLPKRNLYEILKRLQADDMVTKVGSRTSAVYNRVSIQQIQQLNSLLNSANPEEERISGSIQHESFSGSPGRKVIIFDESDQNLITFPGKVGGGQFEPLSDQNGCDVDAVGNTAIQHDSTRIQHDLEQGGSNLDRAGNAAIDSRFNTDSTSNSTAPPKVIISPGKKVKYVGDRSTLARVCGSKHLTVDAVDGDRATVSHKDWQITQTIDLDDLRPVR